MMFYFFETQAIEAVDRAESLNETNHDNKGIAIIAMAGIFPDTNNADSFWDKVESGRFLELTDKESFGFGRIAEIDLSDPLNILGLSTESYALMGQQQKLIFKVIADAINRYNISLTVLSAKKTGVFIGAEVGIEGDNKVAYRIPIPNEVSFQLNLKGPSEVFNTFCTSVYVALHRAIQSIAAGECEQAIVGGINTISPKEFIAAREAGLYDELLSQDNKTHSFCDDAKGYTRSDGAGIIIIKPLDQAIEEGNEILATVQGTAVYHGGRGYSVEAPNAQGMKEAIKLSLSPIRH